MRFHKEALSSESAQYSVSENTALWSFSLLQVKQWKTLVNFYLFTIQ